jgi:hypothetical protein
MEGEARIFAKAEHARQVEESAAAYGSGVNVGLGAERLELAARGAAWPPSLHKEDRTDH